jgi:hypothetical protein
MTFSDGVEIGFRGVLDDTLVAILAKVMQCKKLDP